MPRREERKRAGVHDAQVLRSVDACLAVDDGHAVVGAAHLASRGGVVDGHEAVLDKGEDVGVGRHVEAGEVLCGADGDVVLGEDGEDFAGTFEALDGEFLVGGIGEPVWVEDRRIGHVGAGDGDVPTGEGADKTRVDGSVVVTVARVFGLSVRLVSEISTDGQPF